MSEDLLAEFDATEVPPMPVAPSIPASSGMGPIIIGLAALAVVAGGLFIYAKFQRPTSVADLRLPSTRCWIGARRRASPRPPAPPGRRPRLNHRHPQQKPEPPAETEPRSGTPALLKFSPVETTKPDADEPEEAKPQAEKPAASGKAGKRKKPPPAAKKTQPAADAMTTDAFVRAVADARTALADRELAAARKHIKPPRPKCKRRKTTTRWIGWRPCSTI